MLFVDLAILLAAHPLTQEVEERMQEIIGEKSRKLDTEYIAALLKQLQEEADRAVADVANGIPIAAQQLAFLEQMLLIFKHKLAVRCAATSGDETKELETQIATAGQAVQQIYRHVTDAPLRRLSDETLDLLLHVIERAERDDEHSGHVCLDAFAKVAWRPLDDRRAEQFVSAICGRLAVAKPSDLEPSLAHLEEMIIREKRDQQVDEGQQLIEYILPRLAHDESFPHGVNEHARSLLEKTLKQAKQAADEAAIPASDEELRQLVDEFFKELDDTESPREAATLYALGVATRILRKQFRRSFKVAFVWPGEQAEVGEVGDHDPLRYYFFHPAKAVTTTRPTLARKAFQCGIAYSELDVATDNTIVEPEAQRGFVAAIPCLLPKPNQPPGVLHVSCGKVDKEELPRIKKQLEWLAKLCAYANLIGSLRERSQTASETSL